MRFGGRRTSDNVESQSGGGFGFGGGGGGGGAMLLGLVFSRFGIGGVVVLLAVMFFLGGNPLGLMDGGQSGAPSAGVEARGGTACSADPARRFPCQVLASTEDRWTELLRGQGSTYAPPTLVFYPGSGVSACGAADSAMGPFYCPADRRIYLDTSFFDELSRRYGAPGDFAQAYVVAHEVGHHVQTLTGIEERVRNAQSGASEAQSNAIQVRMELQADCYAGVWASREQSAMEPGDLEEGMRAAAAIGDDTLQRATQGRVVPESFTHGSSAQRQEALMRGYRGGTAQACAGYTQGI
ncbi:MAG TPA: neutral zinc metallopeptidase [Allosphingosinicella sp.]|nr:neutral zinc metallopeptidase [Allosphingosinicella sp.]